MKKYIVSFCSSGNRGNEEFWKLRQKRLNENSLKNGNIDGIFSWNGEKLKKTDFYKNNRNILDSSRGAGYWAWKPYIILDSLSKIDNGDFIIYYDVGSKRTNFQINTDINPLIEWACQNNNGILSGAYRPDTLNRRYTKRDCFYYMDCDEEKYWEHPQILATWSIWQKNELSMNIISDWLNFCKDHRIITDVQNQCGLSNFDGFVDHRHDQSILTNIFIKYGLRCYNNTISSGKNINPFIRMVELDNFCLSKFGCDFVTMIIDKKLHLIDDKKKINLLIDNTGYNSTGEFMHTKIDIDGSYQGYEIFDISEILK